MLLNKGLSASRLSTSRPAYLGSTLFARSSPSSKLPAVEIKSSDGFSVSIGRSRGSSRRNVKAHGFFLGDRGNSGGKQEDSDIEVKVTEVRVSRES